MALYTEKIEDIFRKKLGSLNTYRGSSCKTEKNGGLIKIIFF
jgi:hypothetical protein